MEIEAGKQRRKRYIQDAVLATLATTGVIAVAALAPTVLIAVGQIARQRGYKKGWKNPTRHLFPKWLICPKPGR